MMYRRPGRPDSNWYRTLIVAVAALALMLLTARAFAAAPNDDAHAKPAADAPKPTAEQLSFYKEKVLPILAANCLKCHGGEAKIKGGLNLTSRAGILKGGDSGPAVALDKPDKSILLVAISYDDPFVEMPPKGKLKDDEIAVLTKWVAMGVPMPADSGKTVVHSDEHEPQINDKTRSHWSFQKVKQPTPPKVEHMAWVRNPIDAFILARLEAADLKPSAPAEKAELLRRVTYDLTGLPPTPAEVRAFLNDDSPNAYERVVDRLLASPHYGEKWGRHWLDLVHYAESNSFERDNPKPEVWRYRDYVIRAFNEDKPYDQFIREQLAGDELANPTPDSIIATGYYRLGLWDDESADPPQSRFDEMDDWVSTTSQAFLGLTIGCARCHDHKLDPVPQADYYRLLAFFRDVKSFQNGRDGMGKGFNNGNFHVPLSSLLGDEQRANLNDRARNLEQLKQVEADIAAIEAQVAPKLVGGEKDDFAYESNRLHILRDKIGELIDAKTFERYERLITRRRTITQLIESKDAKVLAITADPTPPQTHVMIRGSAHARGKAVEPGFPQVLGFEDPTFDDTSKGSRSAGRRIVLANWIASEDNPLTARVMVNRIWQHHFGRGLVTSPNNFGLKGDAPTHPMLLDFLAAEFMQRGWSMKQLHRLVLLSNTYRMSSRYNAEAYAKDPKNDLFWRFDIRRLTAEEIRDSLLAVNGKLNLQMHGPSIYTLIPREVLAGQSRPGQNWNTSPEPQRNRRSIYIHVKRSLIDPFLEQFDFADTDNTCPTRFATTQPTQALGMMNSDFVVSNADVFAKRLEKEAGDDVTAQVTRALWLVTQREPTAEDVARGVKLIESLKSEDELSDHDALKYFCLVMLNLNEFVYLD